MEAAKRDYESYCTYVHEGKWIAGKHLKLVCKNVEDLIFDRTGKKNILIISMPPQHGKSQSVTETLPSFYLGKFPDNRVIEASYGDDLAQRFGRRNKDKIIRFGKDLFNIELSKTQDTEFEIKDRRGSMISKGIMAGLTGNPADLIVIDDVCKNRQEAESETYRDRIWDEFLNSVYTRLSAKGKIIVIMTRWHEDDLAGRLLSAMPDKCIEINIPLEAEENDILGRKVGDALFPEIGKDNAWLKDFKTVYTSKEGSRSWQALMQGHPTAAEGNMIKRDWFKYYKEAPLQFEYMLQSWDCTFKDSDGSDFVVGQVWGKLEGRYYLLDQVRDRMDFPTTLRAMEQMNAKYPNVLLKLVEDKANGSAAIAMLRNKVPGIVAVNPKGGKVARLNAVAPAIESGNVYLPEDKPWVYDFVDEFCSFPNGKHDDMVDSASQGLDRLIYAQGSLPKAPYVNPTIEERIWKQVKNRSKKKAKEGWW